MGNGLAGFGIEDLSAEINHLPLGFSLAIFHKGQVLIIGLTDREIRIRIFSNRINFISVIRKKRTQSLSGRWFGEERGHAGVGKETAHDQSENPSATC